MIYLLLAILTGATMTIVMRLSTGKVQSKLSMLATNYAICSVISWATMGFGQPFPVEEGLGAALAMGMANGIFYTLALVMSQYSIGKNGIILSSVFSKVGGLLIPLLVSILLFAEQPTLFQFVGFLLSLAAVFVLNYRKESGGKLSLSLFALLLTEGCAGIMAKVFNELGNSVLSAHFLFYTFAVAFLICVFLIWLKKEKPCKADILYGIGIGVPNFLCARFVLRSLQTVPGVVVYPTRSVATILVISFAGMIFFKEKLSRRQAAAIGVILVALVLLNL